MNDSYNQIVRKNDKKTKDFTTIFNKYFPHPKAAAAASSASSIGATTRKSKRLIKGGLSKGGLNKTKKIRNGGALPIARPLPAANTNVSNVLDKDSNIGYYVVITLNLYPGTSIPLSEKPSLACRGSLNKMKKSWADVFGKIYALQPHYSNDYVQIKDKSKTNTQKAGKNKDKNKKINKTRKRYKVKN
jgi:hypothetical protein